MNSAVLLILFNRPESTQKVFNSIKEARPPRLYISADGPRQDRANESKLCNEVRKIATDVDWPCEVRTNFQTSNLGCKKGVSSAINWFFENELEGIILEDDVVPVISFFKYCDQMLDKYRNTNKVMMISGSNLVANEYSSEDSYLFSRYVHIWGWATWRRAWNEYDVSMKEWKNTTQLQSKRCVSSEFTGNEEFWYSIFDLVADNKIDTWDYQWVYACWKNGGVSINPNVNLINNIGFDTNATHTNFVKPAFVSNNPARELSFPLLHPKIVSEDLVYNQKNEKIVYGFKNEKINESSYMNNYPTINHLHRNKKGKVSDKWESYLSFYEDVFSTYRIKPIRLLEIGIQNGGSLETWSSYFQNGDMFIGCDIDEKCQNLVYDDPRITVVVGDANKLEAFSKITSLSSNYDIIIDDGSHISIDIINSFLNYFPILKPGGTYIVEDTHCLYLSSFGGGILNEYSAYAFFKRLIDIISFQFWSDQVTLQTYMQTFLESDKVPNFILDGAIESIEFKNSLIKVTKSKNYSHNKIGNRLIVGTEAIVNSNILNLKS
jgi:hypothetical protein